jgi:predicted aspartyl protease
MLGELSLRRKEAIMSIPIREATGASAETSVMGRVVTPIVVENVRDALDAHEGKLAADKVRRIAVDNALVDTGASTLSLPSSMIRELGLTRLKEKRVITSQGPQETSIYSAVRLYIQDRDCTVDVVEIPDGVPVLVGQVPLELMDYVVDPVNQRIIGNPEHNGEWILELL